MELRNSWRMIGESLIPRLSLSPLRGASSVRAKSLRHGKWHALFSNRQRSVLVPAGHRAARRSGLSFFITSPWNLFYAKTLLQANDWLPRINLLPELTLPPVEGPTLLDQLPLCDASQLAFQIGTPGPYQKAAVLIMSGEGTPHALAKIALKPSADDMIHAEARWLSELTNCQALAGKVPKLLRLGKASNGRGYLALSVAPPEYLTTSTFTPDHAEFLRDLAQMKPIMAHFTESPAFRYIETALLRLKPALSSENFRLLAGALDDSAQRLAHWTGPFVVAHGDFAPWNVRVYDHGIFAFDWEYARDGSNPLHDIFHFLLAPQAVSKRGISPAGLQDVLSKAGSFAQQTYSTGGWNSRVIAVLALMYLLHTVLWYSVSCGCFVESHPVINNYCKLIEERAQWI